MNAQEALKNFFIAKKTFEDEVYNSMEVIEDFIDQSNAKPKTLEELGWEVRYNASICGTKYQTYEKGISTIYFTGADNIVKAFNWQYGQCLPCMLSYEEILAIAEKMKELGMTNEKEN